MFESDISLRQPSCTTEGPAEPLMSHSLRHTPSASQRNLPELTLSWVDLVGDSSACVARVLHQSHVKTCPSALLHRQTESCCDCHKSPAVISATVAGRTSTTAEDLNSVWSVFLCLFARQQGPQCQRLVRGCGPTDVRSAPCVAALSTCSKGEPFTQPALCNALKCLLPQSWCSI